MNALCDWIPLGGGQWKCSICGKVRTWNGPELPPMRNCATGDHQAVHDEGIACLPPSPPTLVRRALNFAKAVFSQAALGVEALLGDEEIKLVRSPEEIKAIAAICKACPLFNGQVCTHKDCGCVIDEDRSAWWSKIAWKSQRCPDEPPRW